MPNVSEEQVVLHLLAQRTRLMAYLCAIVGDPCLAEDIYQEVSLEAIRQRAKLFDVAVLPKWLRQTARYKALAVLKANRREKERLSEAVLDHFDQIWDEKLQQHRDDYVAALRDCMAGLAPRSKEIVSLRYAESKQGTEVARLLGIGQKSLYVAMSRIHRRLRECINRKLAGEESHG